MVGVGEATLGPAALSLLSDYFPARLRATVQGVYTSGSPSAAASPSCSAAGSDYGWRWAFYLLGFPGLAGRRPRLLPARAGARTHGSRGGPIRPGRLEDPAPLRAAALPVRGLRAVRARRQQPRRSGGWPTTCASTAWTCATIGVVAGILALAVGVPVTILGGYIADRFRRLGAGGRMAFTRLGGAPLGPALARAAVRRRPRRCSWP